MTSWNDYRTIFRSPPYVGVDVDVNAPTTRCWSDASDGVFFGRYDKLSSPCIASLAQGDTVVVLRYLFLKLIECYYN